MVIIKAPIVQDAGPRLRTWTAFELAFHTKVWRTRISDCSGSLWVSFSGGRTRFHVSSYIGPTYMSFIP